MNNKKFQKRTIDEKKILTKEFDTPIILVTYKGDRVINGNVDVRKYDLLIDKKSELSKLEIMFAFPYSRFENIKSSISLKKQVTDLNLTSVEKLSDRPIVGTYEDYVKGTRKNVSITMRTGHTLKGKQIWASKYNILLNVDKQKILIYKHGIFSYQISGQEQITSKPNPKQKDKETDV